MVPTLLFCDDPQPTWIWPYCQEASFVSDSWWDNYTAALERLENNTENYLYPEIAIHFSGNSDQEPVDTIEQIEQRSGWYQDSSADRVPRACVYAWCKAIGKDIALEDILIYLKPSGNEANMFLAFFMDRSDGCRMTPILKGLNYFSSANMEVARTYILEQVQ